MKYWLLAWNPKRHKWNDLNGGFADLKNRLKQVGKIYEPWSTGVNTSIKEGDRVFLIRLGDEKKGIIASRYAATDVFTNPHWELERALKGERSRHIYVKYDKMVFIEDSPLPMSVLKALAPNFHWSTQSSGISIPEDVAVKLEALWNIPVASN